MSSFYNDYNRAIVRKPPTSFNNAIPDPSLDEDVQIDYKKTLEQFNQYKAALKRSGIKIIELEKLEQYPDSCFVEDNAVLTEDFALITNLGTKLRQGEEEFLEDTLNNYYSNVRKIEPPAKIEGGDVLRVGDKFYIGNSNRTNKRGIEQFKNIALRFGYKVTVIPVSQFLHLKTATTFVGDNTVIASEDFPHKRLFYQLDVIEIPKEESYASNCLLVNNNLVIPSGFPKSEKILRDLPFNLLRVDMTEFKKMNGGLTCLSLLF